MKYKDLSQIERYQIASLIKAQNSITQIAKLHVYLAQECNVTSDYRRGHDFVDSVRFGGKSPRTVCQVDTP